MRKLLLCLLLFFSPISYAVSQTVAVLCYHDIVSDFVGEADPDAVTVQQFIQHVEWLRSEGYTFISGDQLVAISQGQIEPPAKAVALTFDDGYLSFYTKVFPLLREWGIPAISGITGTWVDAPLGDTVIYDYKPIPREHFMTWPMMKELAASGLVTFASHSYNLHTGVQGNPQGNLEPSANTLEYQNGKYETSVQHRARIALDLAKNQRLLHDQLGVSPQIMVWPFGRYSGEGLELAAKAGMPLSLSLAPGLYDRNKQGHVVPRQFVRYNATLTELKSLVQPTNELDPVRVMHVDLDYVADVSPEQENKNLSKLLDRIVASGANTVFLQAYSDETGDGLARSLYFPNRHLPVKSDLFNRVAWQIETRTKARVYAWMPVLAFDLPFPRVVQQDGTEAAGYPRLSPFNAEGRGAIREIYEDLAEHAHFSGLLFHDDATLSESEDWSADGRAAYATNRVQSDEAATFRTKALDDFTLDLINTVKYRHPWLKTARNIYARPILEPDSVPRFSQSLKRFLDLYDYTAIMAMPFMEQEEPGPFFARLYAALSSVPKNKVILEFQAQDWAQGTPVAAKDLAQWMKKTRLAGFPNYGYYPDDFIKGVPELSIFVPVFSTKKTVLKPWVD